MFSMITTDAAFCMVIHYTPIIQLCNSLKRQSPKCNSGSSPENISTSGALPCLIGVEANILPVVFISPSYSEYVVFSGIDNTPDLKSIATTSSCSISSVKVLSNSDNCEQFNYHDNFDYPNCFVLAFSFCNCSLNSITFLLKFFINSFLQLLPNFFNISFLIYISFLICSTLSASTSTTATLGFIYKQHQLYFLNKPKYRHFDP